MSNSRVWFITGSASGFGRIDVLVNNAGIGFVGALEERSLVDLRDVMEIMFLGPAALTRAVVPRMRAQGGGAIVQISSMGGQITAPGYSAYCAVKFALEGLSEAVAAEVAPVAIRVHIESEDGRRAGDPAKAVGAILTALDAEQPPLRLALGADAIDGIRAKHGRLRDELSRWEDLSRATAFDA